MPMFLQLIVNIEDRDLEEPTTASPADIVRRLENTLVASTQNDDGIDWTVRWVSENGVIKG